jgi:hypothetical protein
MAPGVAPVNSLLARGTLLCNGLPRRYRRQSEHTCCSRPHSRNDSRKIRSGSRGSYTADDNNADDNDGRGRSSRNL